jgi:hypothetical protein
MKLMLLRQHPKVRLSSKMTTYFVTGVLANVGFASLSYIFGQLVWWWLN